MSFNSTPKFTAPARNADGQVKPFAPKMADVNNSTYIEASGEDTKASGILQVNGTGFNDLPLPGGNDSSAYSKILEDSLHETFNGSEFREGVDGQVLPSEFRDFRNDPTPVVRHTLVDRSVIYDRNSPFDPSKDAPEVTIPANSTVIISPLLNPREGKPMATGLMVSASTFVSDFNMIGGYTHDSVKGAVEDIKYQFEQKMFSQVAKVLDKAATLNDVSRFTAPTLINVSPSKAAEEILDWLTEYVPTHLGDSLSDFAILLPAKMHAKLERAAHKAGLEDVSELIGASVFSYSDEGKATVYMLPKRYAMLSFRTINGEVAKVIRSRDAGRQGWNVEIILMLEVMAAPSIKIKDGDGFPITLTNGFPLVTAIDFTGERAK
ncbi:hypothetical protein ACTUSR_17020 [Pantoea stewartii subsp. indologenes]|uniref:hypothetical protein n=1 Tax=Pantoea stewartii TaxID=66269 RepID=UPI003FA40E28